MRLRSFVRALCVMALPAFATAPAAAGGDEYDVRLPGIHDVAGFLAAQGFVSWDEIEFEDGVWEVDDARRADGREFDLKLDGVTLAILKVDR